MVDSPNPNQVTTEKWRRQQEIYEDVISIVWKMSCSMPLTSEEQAWIDARPKRAEGEYD